MTADKPQKVGRLALRQEGENWNAYYAMPESMEGAIWLGSIKLKFVPAGSARYAAFLSLMRECLADVIEETFGARPTFPDGVQPAPDNERAGNA